VEETSDAPASAPNVLVYGIEDRVPIATAVLVGIQHVCAMVVGTITPPLLLASALKFEPGDTAYFISIALLASALGALLQCRQRGPLGAGLLSVTGTSFAFMQPLTQAWHAGGLAMMFGLSCFIAPVQIALAPFIARLRRFFTPLVSGVVVLLIGASLIPTAFFGLSTPVADGAPGWLSLLIGLGVIAVIVGAQATRLSWARIGGVALGITFGCVAAAMFGGVHAPSAMATSWLTIPKLLPHGLAFSWSLVPPFAFIYLVSSLEAMGDMTATSQLSGLSTKDAAHGRRLSGGVMTDGVVSTLTALIGGFPSTTYAQNNGVIQITGVASRRIGYVVAAILAVLGFVPMVGRWISVIPPPVLGALALLLFGLVAVSGLRLIASEPIGQREAVIVALALGIGLGLPTQPALLHDLPAALRTLLESGISAGGLTALLLNAVWAAPRKIEVAAKRPRPAQDAVMTR
jgi:xanthine permease XanP